jgi:hypothetical protein
MFASLTGFPTKGRLFCSIMMLRTLNGRERTEIPARAATASIRLTDRYEYVLPRKRKKSRVLFVFVPQVCVPALSSNAASVFAFLCPWSS